MSGLDLDGKQINFKKGFFHVKRAKGNKKAVSKEAYTTHEFFKEAMDHIDKTQCKTTKVDQAIATKTSGCKKFLSFEFGKGCEPRSGGCNACQSFLSQKEALNFWDWKVHDVSSVLLTKR